MLPHLALPAFNDNYIWLLRDAATRQCAVVDPGDPAPVQQWLQDNPGWTLTDILITHHHQDHTGGLAALKQATGARASGPALEKIAGLDQVLNCVSCMCPATRWVILPMYTKAHSPLC